MTMEFHYFENEMIVKTRHIEDVFCVYQAQLAAGAQPLTPSS